MKKKKIEGRDGKEENRRKRWKRRKQKDEMKRKKIEGRDEKEENRRKR